MGKKTTETAIVRAGKGVLCNAAQNALTPAMLDEFERDALADLAKFTNLIKDAALIAFRNGARMLAVQHAPGAKRGDLEKFMKRLEGKGACRRTLNNHKSIAAYVYEKAGWLNEKGALVDHEHPSEVLATQLELFTTPEAKTREDVVGEVCRIIGDKGVRDMLALIAEEHEEQTTGQAKKFGGALGNTSAKKLTAEQLAAAAEAEAAKERARVAAEIKKTITDFATWAQTDPFFHADAKTRTRPTLAAVKKLKNTKHTISHADEEDETLLRVTCEGILATLKHLNKERGN